MSESIDNKTTEEKKGGNSKRNLILLLLLLLMGSLGYNYYSQKSNNATEKVLAEEKDLLNKELAALRKSFDEEILVNKNVSEELKIERDKVLKLMDELKKSGVEIQTLRIYRKQAQELKINMSQLISENKMLKTLNSGMKKRVDSTFAELNKTEIKSKALAEKVKTLSQSIERGSVVKPFNLTLIAINKRVSSKTKREATTNRANKTNELKVCFSLPENKIAKKSSMDFYIQIMNSKNQVMGKTESITFEGKELVYTFAKPIKYENENLDVCDYLDVSLMPFEKGKYTVQLFNKGEFISKADLILN